MVRTLRHLARIPLLGVLTPSPAVQKAAKPDFSGTWKLNLAKSKLEIPPPDSSTFQIAHKEPAFHLQRTHVFQGTPHNLALELTTDGREVIHRVASGREVHIRLLWQGDRLVFDSFWFEAGAKTTNVVTYSLSGDAKVFTADQRVSGPKDRRHNLWVFDRQ